VGITRIGLVDGLKPARRRNGSTTLIGERIQKLQAGKELLPGRGRIGPNNPAGLGALAQVEVDDLTRDEMPG
jgi:hypothetical protein